MLITGIRYAKGVSRKTGNPFEAYVIEGLSRRSDDSVQQQSVWISPAEYSFRQPKVGDQIRAFTDGGILIIDGGHYDGIDDLLSAVL